jgi:hypothetical protein
MTRMFSTFAVALAVAAALATGFVSSATAKPNLPPGECVLDDGYNRFRPCSGGDGS